MAKLPYGPAALPVLARRSRARLPPGSDAPRARLDLDNTLLGRGEPRRGLGGIVVGQAAEGEAFVDFQVVLKALSARGIVLAVASKKDTEVARRPFLEHPEMLLKLDDTAAFAASWGPKSERIPRSPRRSASGSRA